MVLIDGRTVRVLLTALLFVVVLGFLYTARHTLIAFLFAIFFAYLVYPAVSYLEKWTHGRGRSIAVIYFLIAVALFAIFFSVGPQIGDEARHLGESLPPLVREISSGQIAERIGTRHGWSSETIQQAKKFLTDHQGELADMVQKVGLWVADVAKQSWLLVVVPILAAFFLKDADMFGQLLLSLPPRRRQREFMAGVVDDLNQMLAQFIRAQLILAALSAVVYTTFLGIAGVPYALVLGTAGGLLEFIPVLGPLVAAASILGISILMGYHHWLVLLVFLLVWRMLQDYVISPRIMASNLELHPLAALFGILAGGEIAGVLGVYLSIPVMASLRIVWRRWRMYAEKQGSEALQDVPVASD